MVCPKLSDGVCSLNGNPCEALYRIKMVMHKKCATYTRARAKASKSRKRR